MDNSPQTPTSQIPTPRTPDPSAAPDRAPHKLRRRRTIAFVTAGVVAASSLISALWVGDSPSGAAGPATHTSSESNSASDTLQSSLDDLITEGGFPGALAAVTEPDGTVTNYVAGRPRRPKTASFASRATPRCLPPWWCCS